VGHPRPACLLKHDDGVVCGLMRPWLHAEGYVRNPSMHACMHAWPRGQAVHCLIKLATCDVMGCVIGFVALRVAPVAACHMSHSGRVEAQEGRAAMRPSTCVCRSGSPCTRRHGQLTGAKMHCASLHVHAGGGAMHTEPSAIRGDSRRRRAGSMATVGSGVHSARQQAAQGIKSGRGRHLCRHVRLEPATCPALACTCQSSVEVHASGTWHA
jgi:hypothetical protein